MKDENLSGNFAEMQPNLSNVSANREQNKTNLFVFYAEAQANLSNVSAN